MPMKMFLSLLGHRVVLCLFFPAVFKGQSETLIPSRMTAKISGTLMEVSQDLIYMKELYMSDKNIKDK